MNELATVDMETGEVLADLSHLQTFVVPATADDMVEAAQQSQRAAFGHHWRTAAMVYAWTFETGGGRPKKSAENSPLFTIDKFANLGIRGLLDRKTVAKYRAAMQRAIDDGLCSAPEPGKGIALPAVEFAALTGPKPANYSSDTNEWYTPPEYIESVREVFGGQIDLDPCSCEKANETVKAGEIFTAEDEAENLEWFGRVFMNPPYGKKDGDSQAGLFCQKLIDEYRAGRVSEGIILVNSVHAQRWQAPLYEFPICLVDHRIEFMDDTGRVNPNPTFMNLFVYLGENKAKFAEAFSRHGYVMERMK